MVRQQDKEWRRHGPNIILKVVFKLAKGLKSKLRLNAKNLASLEKHALSKSWIAQVS